MKTLMTAILASLSIVTTVGAMNAEEAWSRLVGPRFQGRAEFAFVKNETSLPNVLIYGDSISIAYTQRVRTRLRYKANVYRLHMNGGDSGSFIEKMKTMHQTMRDENLDDAWAFDWDVIHFNVGLHDLKYLADGKLDKTKGEQVMSLEAYETNLRDILNYLQELAPTAKLIFATTTPVPEGEKGRRAGDALRYNQVALKVMADTPQIKINDLYALTKPKHTQWWTKPGNVHFNQQGSDAQGDEVVRTILQVLKEKSAWAGTPAVPASMADLTDLRSWQDWEEVAPGVWRASVGDLSQETRYTDLAAHPPRLESLRTLPRTSFPLGSSDIRVLQTDRQEIVVRLPTAPGEKLYGFGLQFDGLRKGGQVLTLNVDHWAKGGGRTHAPVPFYLSSRGYGVFFNTARFLKVHAQVGNRKDSPNNPEPVDRNPMPDEKQSGRWQARPAGDAVEAYVQAQGLEVLVFAGPSLLNVVQRYNLYAGGGALPPLWGLGFWHRVPAKFSAEQTRTEIETFAKKNIPLDVIGLEPGWMTKSYPCTFEWNRRRFPDPAGFTQELLDRGIRLNLWENPYISPAAQLYEAMFPLSGSHLVWLGLVPDYTLPAARRLLTEQHGRDHIAIGISGYKIDEVDGYDHWLWPDYATFPSGTSGETMRQTYGLLMQRMLYQDLFQQRNVRTYGLVRASNGAASGYPFVIYSDAYRHAEYITGLSAASLCGILWAPETRSAGSAREWLNRIQTSCFSPLAMLNAWASSKKPWSYPEVTDAVRTSIELRLRLLPYLYTAFADYHFHGIPPIRAMILETDSQTGEEVTVVQGTLDGETNPYAQERVVERNDQFMFGPLILVAPFYESQATERQVQLPRGRWYDFYTGQFVGSKKTITVTARQTNDRMPLYVKQGAVIPLLNQAIANTDQAYGCDLELRLYGQTKGVCQLYEDDGKSFDYMNGQYTLRKIEVQQMPSGELSFTEKRSSDELPPLFGPVTCLKLMGKQ